MLCLPGTSTSRTTIWARVAQSRNIARNIEAIRTLFKLEEEHRGATAEEQQVLSQYVGWGGLTDAFDPSKDSWAKEYAELTGLLSEDEYAAARSSTLNAHYTSPTVIRAIYDAVERMGFQSGNILEPSMGVGNFFGMLPTSMADSRLYGVELDSITGRIAKKLYPQADITVAGFETTDRRDFYDLAVGNVPFGQYKVNDKAYNKLGFSIQTMMFRHGEQVMLLLPVQPPIRAWSTPSNIHSQEKCSIPVMVPAGGISRIPCWKS